MKFVTFPTSARIAAALLAFASTTAPAQRVPDPPALDARSYVLMDFESGQILAAKEPQLRVGPASLTKVMLVYVAFDELRQGRIQRTDTALISEKAWRQGIHSRESRMFVEVGKRVAVEDLLRGIIVQSGNDASIALAEHLAGTEEACAGLMNRYARDLGMTQTQFANATGVPADDQYTTAEDMARLSRALIRDFPNEYALFKEKEYTFNKIRQPNRNLLLWRDPSVDGIKTGHTEAAGYHLAASSVRDGRRLIAVVLGTDSEKARADATLALLNFGYRFYDTVPVHGASTALTTVRVWKGAEKELGLGLAAPLVVSVPRGGRERLEVELQPEPTIFAPVAAGQPLGSVIVRLDGQVLRQEPLVALTPVPEGSWWRRLIDALILWVRALL